MDPGLQEQVDAATRDLEERLGGPGAATITVLSAERVTWRSGALGCPKPDRAYPMVLTAGVRIRLEAGGEVFHYHGGKRGRPFLCEPPGVVETPTAANELDDR